MSLSHAWSGIEQWKYGLTARWYVSARYGNDNDVDNAGLYHPKDNPEGHGGKTRPFATIDKSLQNDLNCNLVVDNGVYSINLPVGSWGSTKIIGDGTVKIRRLHSFSGNYYNTTFISLPNVGWASMSAVDCSFHGSYVSNLGNFFAKNCIFFDSHIHTFYWGGGIFRNCTFAKCSGHIQQQGSFNNLFLNCERLNIEVPKTRSIAQFADYNILIGGVRTTNKINGKTSNVNVEDFKIHKQHFLKSYSEVDLFGKESGSGATAEELNTLFNNYFDAYIDDYYALDFSLKPSAPDILKYGGLNGERIGAGKIGYRFSAAELWNQHREQSTGLQFANGCILLDKTTEDGHFRSKRISLPQPVEADRFEFLQDIVYNALGVSIEGINSSVYPSPDNKAEQAERASFLLSYSSAKGGELRELQPFELNTCPEIDKSGKSAVQQGFDRATAQPIRLQDFVIDIRIKRRENQK
ncbi:MAG: hypothetical protein MI784_07270 [Cytophagales bacterium]|nr:hypothetical protein [Cytophagales bacterium]